MIPEYLALEGFIGYQRRTELDFSGRDTIGIIGGNEVGKTTLLHAISFAAYGRTLAPRQEQLINDFSSAMRVELKLRLPGKTLEIMRGVEKGNQPICEVAGFRTRKASEAAAYIAEQIALSYQDFIGLSYFQQGDIHGFLSGDKRAYFQRWTSSLATWKRLEEAATVREREISRALDAIEAEKAQATEILDRVAEIKAESRAANANVVKHRADAELINEAVRKLEAQVTRSESQETLKEAIDSLRKQLVSTDRQIAAAEQARDQISRQARQESQGVCPLLGIQCPELSEASRKRKAELLSRVSAQRGIITDLTDQRAEIISKGKKLRRKVVKSPIATLKADLAKAKKDLIEANRELKFATRRKAEADVRLDQVTKAKKRAKVADEAIKVKRNELRRSQFLRFMCGRSGIPATLIETELQHVEDKCNGVFRRLDYPKRISFKGYKELGSFERVCLVCGASSWHRERCKDCGAARQRKRKEEPTVTIIEGSVERPFELESGGAKVLSSFAVRLSAGLFVSAMTGTPLDAVFLDEVFAMLDPSNRSKVLAMVIDKLKTEFGIQRQFVVSHAEDITHTIDDLIMVSKERGSSVARWM